MSEIPADIMAVAESIAADIPSRATKHTRGFAANVIARAILAERERCAQVAEAAPRIGVTLNEGEAFLCGHIARLIREAA